MRVLCWVGWDLVPVHPSHGGFGNQGSRLCPCYFLNCTEGAQIIGGQLVRVPVPHFVSLRPTEELIAKIGSNIFLHILLAKAGKLICTL